MIKLNSTCKGRSNAKRTREQFWNEKVYSGCELGFVLPIWLFCACVLINLLGFPIISSTSMHALHSFCAAFLWRFEQAKKYEGKQQVKCQVWQVCDFILPLVPSNLFHSVSCAQNNQLQEMCNKMALIQRMLRLTALRNRHKKWREKKFY